MNFKLLVLDVDGTLVSDNSQNISDSVINSILSAKDKVQIALCTGRSLADLDQIIHKTGLINSYHIVESGSKLLKPGLQVEFVRDIALEEAKTIIEEGIPFADGYSMCVDGKWYESSKSANVFDEIDTNKPITTVSFYIDDSNQTEKIIQMLPKLDNYKQLVTSHWNNPNGNQIMYTNKLGTKKESLEYLQNKLGITIEETMCIGDMPNDLPMFERSGFKICMENGHDELKAKADYITKSVKDDGVAFAIKKFILNE